MSDERIRRAVQEYNRFAERTGSPGRMDSTLAFERPELVFAAEMWRRCCGDRRMPPRSALDPKLLKSVLPHVAIIDVVSAIERRRFRIRLMGTAVARIFGDHTGKFVDEAIVPPYAERWSSAFDAAIRAGGPCRLAGRVEYKQIHHVSAELVLAPMGERETVDSILAVAYAKFSTQHIFVPMIRETISASPGA